MAPGNIMCPQLGGCDSLDGASQDRGFRLDHNSLSEPNDCEQFDLLSAKSRKQHNRCLKKAHMEALMINLSAKRRYALD
jgi:hypothetical protein